MPGFVIHIAIGKEYLRKNNNIENVDEFIKGNIAPDLTEDKTKTHYGESPTFTNLKEFLVHNKLDNSFNKGKFLHLISDYLFYNQYLKTIPRKESKEILHADYDIINKALIEKYNIDILEDIKKYVHYKEGNTKILTLDFIIKVIDDISNLNLQEVEKEVIEGNKKWQTYKLI